MKEGNGKEQLHKYAMKNNSILCRLVALSCFICHQHES